MLIILLLLILTKNGSDALQKIKDEGLGIKEQIRVDNEAKEKEYQGSS